MWTTLLPIEPGEDLRSFSDRLALVNSVSPSQLARQGGGKWATPAWGLPTGLRQLAVSYGAVLQLPTAQDWMREHTLAPYYFTTLPIKRRSDFEVRLLDYRPGPRRPVLAIAAVEWFAPTAVVCPLCDEEHVSRLGYSIVLRQWLLPFATRCAVHGELLQRFPAWTPAARGQGSVVEVRPMRRPQGLQATRAGQDMLRTGECLLEELGSLLQSRGFLGGKGRIRRKELCTALVAHATGRFEHVELDALLASLASVERLLSPLWNPKKCLHPAVANALLQALRDAEQVSQAQLWAPSREAKRSELLTALDNCRTLTEAAKAAGVSVTTAAVHARAADKDFAERPKKLDTELRARVEDLLRKGHAIVATAKCAGVSAVTVYRVLNANPQLKAALRTSRRAAQVQARRGAWRALIEANPNASRKELRSLAPADYAFLYRHDREWLTDQPPAAAKPRSPAGARPRRVPPGAVEQFKTRLTQAKLQDAMELPARLTPTRLLALAGKGAWSTATHSAEFKQAVIEDSETLGAFVRRRLSAASARLHNAGQALTAWAVMRESRLRAETIDRSGVRVEEVMVATRRFNTRRRA